MRPLNLVCPVVERRQCSIDALADVPVKACYRPASLELLMDGSGADPPCWSFAVLWYDANGRKYFGGYRCGLVATDLLGSEFIGAKSADSNAAELSAFIWGMSYWLQHCHGMCGPTS